MNEEQQDRARKVLPSLIMNSYTHIAAAAMLLNHKAAASPNSAEAKAYSLLVQAKNEIDRWILNAGQLLDINIVQAELIEPARQLASSLPPGSTSSPQAVEASA